MAVTVKKKIWYGTAFLFLLLLLTGVFSIYYLGQLKNDAKRVLQDNYESLSYCHNMQKALNSIEAGLTPSRDSFELNLEKQENNVTEPGEKKVTDSLRATFNKIKNGDTIKQQLNIAEMQLQQILQLNMQAIQYKNSTAQKSADKAFTIISLLSGLVFLIAFSFLLNFPSIVTKPILRFTESIKEISNKNYAHRIHLDNKDEFGKLADAFNEMAARLQYFENSNLNKLMFEKNRAESVINSLRDASIGLDKNSVVLFANEQALQLLNMRNEDIVGKKATDVAERNDLFKFLMENNSSAPFKIVIQNRENYFIKEVIDVAQNEMQSKVIVAKNITSFKELDEAKTNFSGIVF